MTLTRAFAAATAVMVFAACADQPTAPLTPTGANFSVSSTGLLECPTSTSQTASKTIDTFGGDVSVAGSSVTLPFGAVSLPTRITLTVPASNYVEIDARANDAESFKFEQPVNVSISYARCTRSDISKHTLTAWQINPVTKARLEQMNATHDPASKKVNFSTDHFSGYAIGYSSPPDSTGTGN